MFIIKWHMLPCPGFFCLKGSSVPSPCPVGHVNPSAGRTSLSDCSPCPSGFFCNSSALTEPSGPCSPGLTAWEFMSDNRAIGVSLSLLCLRSVLSCALHWETLFFDSVLNCKCFSVLCEMSDHIVYYRAFLFPGMHRAFSRLPALWRCLSHGTLLPSGKWVSHTLSCRQLLTRARSFLPPSVSALSPREILPQSWSLTANRCGIEPDTRLL